MLLAALLRPRPVARRFAATLVALAALVACAARGHAQVAAPTVAQRADSVERLTVSPGRVHPMTFGAPVTRVAVADTAVADVMVVSDRDVVVTGRRAGESDVLLWTGGQRRHYRVSVSPASDRPQVVLAVKFAEVRRDVLTRVGLSAVRGGRTQAGVGTYSTGMPTTTQPGQTTSSATPPFASLLTDLGARNVLALLEAEEQRGNARTLAEPTLMAANRDTASFLAGGEFPIPAAVAQGPSGQPLITIVFREFGVRLSFSPEILSDSVIKLHVRPEVSSLDNVNAVVLSGVRVPALRTRRLESTVDVLRDQSLVISGLMSDERERVRTGIPGLVNVPVLGALFSSTRWQRSETELIVVVTPTIVDPSHPRRQDTVRFLPDSTLPARDALTPRLPARDVPAHDVPTRDVPTPPLPAPAAPLPAPAAPSAATPPSSQPPTAVSVLAPLPSRAPAPAGAVPSGAPGARGTGVRTVLIAGLAPTPEGAAAAAMERAGYAAPARVPTLETAAVRIARERVDLLIVPLDAPAAALEAAARAAHAAGAGVLGAAARLEAGTLLKGMRAGVQECLVTPYDAEELEAAIGRIERRTAGGVTAGLAVAVYSAKGGIGTTTTAVNLAHAYARNNARARVAVADLVVSGGDVAVQLDMLPKYDVGTIAGKAAALDAELLRSVLAERGPREWVLAASERPEVTELVDGSVAGAIVGQLRSAFDFTTLDCEHHVSDRSLAALDAADRVVLLTQLGLAPLRSAQRSLALFDRLGYPSERVLVVVNRHQSGDVLTLSDAQEAIEHPIAAALPNDFRGCTDALAKGRSVVEHAPDSPLGRAYLELAAKLGGAAPEAPAPAARLGRLRTLFRS